MTNANDEREHCLASELLHNRHAYWLRDDRLSSSSVSLEYKLHGQDLKCSWMFSAVAFCIDTLNTFIFPSRYGAANC